MDCNGQNRHPRFAWWGVSFARSPKAKVIARVLKDRYLRSALLPDISVAALSTFTVRPGAGLGLGRPGATGVHAISCRSKYGAVPLLNLLENALRPPIAVPVV